MPARQENEAHIRGLPDRGWSRLMQSFQESHDAQIERDQHTRFGNEIVEIHQAHYDELLEKIVSLAARQNRSRTRNSALMGFERWLAFPPLSSAMTHVCHTWANVPGPFRHGDSTGDHLPQEQRVGYVQRACLHACQTVPLDDCSQKCR